MRLTIYKTYASLALFASLCLSCSNSEKPTENDSPEQSTTDSLKVQNVEVLHPSFSSFKNELLITGTAEPNREVKLHAMQSGSLKAIYKDIGDMVKKGEVIAILENPEFAWQKQTLEVELKSKKIVYDRLKSIRDKTPALTTLKEVDDAEADCLLLEAKIKAIDDQMVYLKVKAPFSGIITQRFVDEGAMIQSGINNSNAMALFEIQEINPIRLNIPLPETDARSVKKGMTVTVNFPELPGVTFNSKVSRTANSLDRKSKTMRVEIDIPNSNRQIKPGMYAKAYMLLSVRDSVLSLPVTAQVILQKKPYVMTVEDGKVKQVPLIKGLYNKDYFELRNTDLSPQSQVIIKGKGLVKPGQIVNAVNKAD